MVGVGWVERSARKATLATLDVRLPSEGTAARGPADSYALEVETMVVIGERDAPERTIGEAVQTTIDRDEPSLRQAFAFMARSPSPVQHGWFRTRHDKNGDRLECRAPAAVDCEPAASES